MAHTVFLRRVGLRLQPTDRASEEIIGGLPKDKVVKAVLTQPRNYKHHKKFFALLGIVLDNQEYFNDTDELLFAVKVKLGYVKEIKLKHGTHLMPTSIAFNKMDQAKFNIFYDKAVTFIINEVIPGMDREDLLAEVENF